MSSALAFDLELDGDTILCAATCWTNGLLHIPQVWVSQDQAGFKPLTPTLLAALLETLWGAHQAGMALVTWGGTGSDWQRLAAALPAHAERIRTMALASVDLPLVSAGANGMMMGLSAAAAGMGLGSRPSCESEDVPRLWRSGDPQRQHQVVQHVQWDAWACACLWARLHWAAQVSRPQLTWVTQRATPRSVRLQRVRTEGGWRLPCVAEIRQWGPPRASFVIPPHLHPAALTRWLEAGAQGGASSSASGSAVPFN